MKREHLGSWILDEEGISKGSLLVEEGRAVELQRGRPASGSTSSLIIPSFVNAHTHIGDSFAYLAPKGTLEDTVAPPDGYKHRMLRAASREKKVGGMRDAAESMLRSGTTHFMDFREEGVEGIEELKEACRGLNGLNAIVLGRPTSPESTDEELSRVLSLSDGLGMSAVRDWPLPFLERAAKSARSAGKRFALHASEAVREDIDEVLGLKPDFLVHMASATDGDLETCAEANVPIIVCPRSNEFFNIDLDIVRMRRAGVELALGTDNGMIAKPNMFEEMRAAYRTARRKGAISPLDVVRMATFCGRKVLNAPAKITPEIGILDDLAVVRVRGEDPLLELCTTAVPESIEAVVQGGRVWRSEAWR